MIRTRRWMSAARRAALAAACLAMLAPAGPAAGQKDQEPKPADRKPARPGKDPGIMLDRAGRFASEGRCDEAVPMLERLVAEYPQISAAKEMLAECYLKSERPRDAIALLEACAAEEPPQFSCLRSLGRAYIESGEKAKGVAAWRRILTIDERQASLYGVVAKLEQEAGLYDEAIATLREGSVFRENGENYSREIIRLERILGRDENAFTEAILLAGRSGGAVEREIGTVAEVFRESRKQERLVDIADSLAAAGKDSSGVFRALRTIFHIETGRYDEVRSRISGARGDGLGEKELYAIASYMESSPRAPGDARFASFREEMLRAFIDRYARSALAPGVMLMLASHKREASRNGGTERGKLLAEAMALADEARRHPFGGSIVERAALFKARVLLDDLRKPDEALAALDGTTWRNRAAAAEAAELRVRIFLASLGRSEATTGLKRIAQDPDSTVAFAGAYGLGKLDFFAGRYAEAVKKLSALAEKHPSSAYANDALELAMEIKASLPEGGAALDLYRAAVVASERGELASAIDSLAALEGGFPESSLAPRAMFMKGELAASSGEPGAVEAARAELERLAESFPLHDLAPRALERLASLAERDDPGEAFARYGRLMERYPDYPFMERVRERYVALGKSAAGPAQGKGAK